MLFPEDEGQDDQLPIIHEIDKEPACAESDRGLAVVRIQKETKLRFHSLIEHLLALLLENFFIFIGQKTRLSPFVFLDHRVDYIKCFFILSLSQQEPWGLFDDFACSI